MSVQEEAVRLHESGFNCAQAVYCSLCGNLGMDERTALAVSGGFGGGVRCGEVCGAVTGAVMAIGTAFPYTDTEDKVSKEKIAELTRELTGEFKQQLGALRCEELKGGEKSCNELIQIGAELAQEIINKNKQE